MKLARFIGRDSELEILKNHWETAREGRPQVINLIADTGVGKTRLVHSFYEWLSAQQSDGEKASKYWPTKIGDGQYRTVNPSIELFDAFDLKNERIPWLWWGLYWTDTDGENECALTRFHELLDTHLNMLELEINFKRKNFRAFVDWAKEEGFSFAADFVPGGKQALNVLELASKVHSNRQEQQLSLQGVSVNHKRKLEDLENRLLERLEIMFNSRNRNNLSVPLIVFLDDIQFSSEVSKDSVALGFLERLLRQAIKSKWPLLIISTYWKSYWNSHDHKKRPQKSITWRRIMHDLVSERDFGLLPKEFDIAPVFLQKLSQENLKKISREMLPGLSEQDILSITKRVDNVRWLLEVLVALRDSDSNFRNNDRDCSLSEFGKKRLNTLLKSRGYLEVIRKRLETDDMREVRQVLGAMAWHASDLNFISSLAGAFGPPLAERGALKSNKVGPVARVFELLRLAYHPAAFIDGGMSDRGLPQLINFSERGYLEIAKELFDSTQLSDLSEALGLEVIDWLNHKDGKKSNWQMLELEEERIVFLELATLILKKLTPSFSEDQEKELSIMELVLSRQHSKGRISKKELQTELEIARQQILGEKGYVTVPQYDVWHAIALAELSASLSKKGEGRCLDIAFELAEHPKVSLIYYDLGVDTIYELSKLWKSESRYWINARNALSICVIKIETALNQLPSESEVTGEDQRALSETDEQVLLYYSEKPELLNELAVVLSQLADLNQLSGNHELALTGYERCIDLHERIIYEFGSSAKMLRNLIVSMVRLADLFAYQNKYDFARKQLARSLTICRTLLNDYGENPRSLSHLGAIFERTALLNIQEENNEKARSYFEYIIKIDERVLERFGETPARLRNLGISLSNLAINCSDNENHKVLEESLNRCIEIYSRIIDKYGENPQRLSDLESAKRNLKKYLRKV